MTRLVQDGPVVDLDALAAIAENGDFEVGAKAVTDAIEKNQPESGLTGFIRSLPSTCARFVLSAASTSRAISRCTASLVNM